jgi:hypothetical protein
MGQPIQEGHLLRSAGRPLSHRVVAVAVDAREMKATLQLRRVSTS